MKMAHRASSFLTSTARRHNAFRRLSNAGSLEPWNPGTLELWNSGMALPNDAHIGQVTLTVRDLDRSALFYQDVLGFRETRRAGRSVFLGAGGRVLMELHENTS